MHKIRSEDEFLTLAQAAQLKGVTRKAVYDAIKAGRLQSRYMLGRMILLKGDVITWKIVGRRSSGPLSETHKTNISKSLKRSWRSRK